MSEEPRLKNYSYSTLADVNDLIDLAIHRGLELPSRLLRKGFDYSVSDPVGRARR